MKTAEMLEASRRGGPKKGGCPKSVLKAHLARHGSAALGGVACIRLLADIRRRVLDL